MNKTAILLCACLVGLTACGGKKSYTATTQPWKQTDKHLTCDQLLLEMNDARFWGSVAARNKEAGIMDVIWPVGYIETRASADEALQATQDRLNHLGNIYQIKGCARPYADTPVLAEPPVQ